LHSVLRYVHRLAGGAGLEERTDRQLLRHFVAERDEGAFALLVRRHGALVWGACRRTLGTVEDAEDVFQATFLILARKAASLRWSDSIAPWLHEVACRLALEARD
jgi:DNA-directed RNA polymerase specialized sigma24 family protein